MVAPLTVVVVLKTQQPPLQVASSPKGHLVEKLPPDRRYEPFHDGLREPCIGHGLHFRDLDNSKVGLASMQLERPIMIAAEISGVPPLRIALLNIRQTDGPSTTLNMYLKVNNPARKMIHHHQHPMALEVEGVAPKQIDAP